MSEKLYTVWVGGVEVNDYYLPKDRAESLAQEYLDDDYPPEDVHVVPYEEEE